MRRNAFTEHPESVGETYAEHMMVAWSFGWQMFWASLACFVHGLLPFLFTRTGSHAVAGLYQRMVTHRQRHAAMSAPAAE